MAYCRESPSAKYRELLAQHALVHDETGNDAEVSPSSAFSGLSLFEQAARVKRLVALTGAHTILDYGSGKGLQYGPVRIRAAVGGEWSSVRAFWGVDAVTCYDPGYTRFRDLPREPSDGVICTEVLEHCPQEDIPWILEEIFRLARRFVCLSIACHPARRTLPNGANTHSTIRPPAWWDCVLREVAGRHEGVLWEAWLRLELRTKGTRGPREQRLGNFQRPVERNPDGRLEITVSSPGDPAAATWNRTFEQGPESADDVATLDHLAGNFFDFYREFGAAYTLRRLVSSAGFLVNPVTRPLAQPLAWVNHRLAMESTLSGLLKGRRVLVLGSGPSASDLESVPSDVVVLTCKFGPEILAEKTPRRRADLYYYPNLRADNVGRDKRLHLASVLRRTRIHVLVCEDLFTLADVLPLRSSYSRLLMDFRSNQMLLRQLIAPTTIQKLRGRSFCPWTSTGVRLLQYALHFGAREIYVIGIDLGEKGYASGHAMRRWHHEDIDRNFLEIISKRHDHVYSLSPNSPAAEHLPVRGWAEL